jgi:hypothetical protein
MLGQGARLAASLDGGYKLMVGGALRPLFFREGDVWSRVRTIASVVLAAWANPSGLAPPLIASLRGH